MKNDDAKGANTATPPVNERSTRFIFLTTSINIFTQRKISTEVSQVTT